MTSNASNSQTVVPRAEESVESPPTTVRTRGSVSPAEVDDFQHLLERLGRPVRDRTVRVKGLLSVSDNAIGLVRSRAKITFELKGAVLRAEARDEDLQAAVSSVGERMRNQIEARQDRERRDPVRRASRDGQWRHGNLATDRPGFYDRPVEDRRVVRRKTYSPVGSSLDEARWDRDQLDFDFYLFLDDAHAERLLHGRGEDERLLGGEAARLMTVEAATALLDASDDPFVFFRDQETGKASVAYRRYDGHYGLLIPG